jgi:hypothetical protein
MIESNFNITASLSRKILVYCELEQIPAPLVLYRSDLSTAELSVWFDDLESLSVMEPPWDDSGPPRTYITPFLN